MADNSTELNLANWRNGQVQAERMVADLLWAEGYINIQPQAPLGGPDGGADVLCERGAYKYIAAAYFPTTEQGYAKLASKFVHDLEGVSRRRGNAFAFFTNQRITVENREKLKSTALNKCEDCEIYDIERLRSILEAPHGNAIKERYLPTSSPAEFTGVDQSNLRNRDVEKIRQAMSRIEVNMLEKYLNNNPDIVDLAIFHFFQTYHDLVTNILFRISDTELEICFHGLDAAWQRGITSSNYSFRNAEGKAFFFRSPGDMPLPPKIERDWNEIFAAQTKMKEYLNNIVNIITRKYAEIDLRETSRIARENWLRIRENSKIA